jgi:hypothetical protein
MALLSFVESAPRAYRLKVGNADLFRNSTEPGTSPYTFFDPDTDHIFTTWRTTPGRSQKENQKSRLSASLSI